MLSVCFNLNSDQTYNIYKYIKIHNHSLTDSIKLIKLSYMIRKNKKDLTKSAFAAEKIHF